VTENFEKFLIMTKIYLIHQDSEEEFSEGAHQGSKTTKIQSKLHKIVPVVFFFHILLSPINIIST